ncbi:unnamed protein product [Durusdinium trenchii]|uniref:Coiled-coil domain-containing protein 57 n=1 Tax=Durusdinium trenchii TaxID=1381693 RepID=A0ABP0QR65_9DINO
MAMASLASKETAGAAMYNVALQEKEMHLLHEQLLRERSELQRTSQLCKAQAEELKRRERLNSSLWEQRVCLERDASELRARLARVESQQQKEVQDLKLKLTSSEALRERAQAELQREVALRQAAEQARQQLTRKEGKDREGLELELQELRRDLAKAHADMQVRLREQEAEFQKQCLELRAARFEEEQRALREAHLLDTAARSPAPKTGEGPWKSVETSRIEGLEELSTLSEGALEAVNKMKLLEEQLRSWQGEASTSPKSVIDLPPTPQLQQVSTRHREAELLHEMQQEHLLTIRLKRQALQARNASLARSASLPCSILDLTIPSLLGHSPVRQAQVPLTEPSLRPPERPKGLEASPNSAGAVLGSSRSLNAVSAEGSPQRELLTATTALRDEAKASPCSCQVLSPALSLEADGLTYPEPVGAGPTDSPQVSDRARPGSPSQAAGRLPPLTGTTAATAPRGPMEKVNGPNASSSPSRRPEVETPKASKTEVDVKDSLETRLREVEMDRENWRRRTVLLEEQLQRLAQPPPSRRSPSREAHEVRWRPAELELEDEKHEKQAPVLEDELDLLGRNGKEAWAQKQRMLEAQLAQTVAERDRMIEATNELRADVRRLTAKAVPSPAGPVLPVTLASPETGAGLRQALQLEGDRFGAMSGSSPGQSRGQSPPFPPHRVTLSLPIPGVGEGWHRQELEVGSLGSARSASSRASPVPPSTGYWPPPPVNPPPPPQIATFRTPSPPMAPPLETPTGDSSPAALRVRDALRMLSPRRVKSSSPLPRPGRGAA